jgi:mannosyltransferase
MGLRSTAGEIAVISLISLAAAVLALARIGAQPLWLDEALSVWVARKPAGELVAWVVANDAHPPLYYLLLHPVTAIGTSEWVVRLPSALFALGTVTVSYAIGRRLRGPVAGAVTATVVAISPWYLRYAQEARSYALLLLTISVALWGFVALFQQNDIATADTSANWTGRLRDRPGPAAAYALGTLAALLTHYAAVYFLVAVNLVVLGWWLAPLGRSRDVARSWVALHLAVGLGYAIWLPSLVRQLGRVAEDYWMTRATLGDGIAMLRSGYTGWDDFTFSLPGASASPWLDIVVLGLVGVALMHARRWGLTLAALPILSVVVGLIVSVIFRPILIERAFLWTVVPIAGLLGIAVAEARVRARWIGVLSSLVLLSAMLPGTVGHLSSFERSPWDEVATYLAGAVDDGDLVVPAPYWLTPPLAYYLLGDEFLAADYLEEAHPLPGGATLRSFTEPSEAMASLAAYERIWLVFSPFHGLDLEMFAAVESVAVETDERSWPIHAGTDGLSPAITVRRYVVER